MGLEKSEYTNIQDSLFQMLHTCLYCELPMVFHVFYVLTTTHIELIERSYL